MGRVPKPTSRRSPPGLGEGESVLGRGCEGMDAANFTPFWSPFSPWGICEGGS